ncbi:MAG: WecB/TagA/CpsF family glycosyltransferase [Bacteroidota bacterium]
MAAREPSAASLSRGGGRQLSPQKVPGANRLYIEDVPLDNIDGSTALGFVEMNAARVDGRKPRTVLFINVHSLHLARRDREMMQCLRGANLVLPDGSGLALAGKLLGHPIGENLNGTDFSPRVLQLARDHGWSAFLLGGKAGIAERCGEVLAARIPGLRIVGTRHGHFSPEEETSIIAEINRVKPDILFVAMGSPIQEKWIMEHVHSLAVGMCFGVGGLFDFLAGERRRAPLWIRRAGLEWVYRFLSDPAAKWERVLVEIPAYVARLLRARLLRQPMLTTEPQFSADHHGARNAGF